MKSFSLKQIQKRGKLPLSEAVSCYGVSFVRDYVNGVYAEMIKNQRVEELKERLNT